jgi:hypothetical protein
MIQDTFWGLVDNGLTDYDSFDGLELQLITRSSAFDYLLASDDDSFDYMET